jgi:hypothetical protein
MHVIAYMKRECIEIDGVSELANENTADLFIKLSKLKYYLNINC